VRLVDEVAARMMTLGYFATMERSFAGWKKAADRFGVRPRTLEEYIAQLSP
jgi:predicted DNA-binding transcriptional regulator YafY